MKRLLRSVAILMAPILVAAQDQSADNEILSLGEKLLVQAKSRYERKDWFEAMELAERARTAFLALSELYSSQNRMADLRKLNESVTQCNQFIRLARDARKAEQDKAAPQINPVAKKPDQSPPAKNPAPLSDPVTKVPEKPAPPDLEAQEKALKTIREVFQADYAKTSMGDRHALARKLLNEATATKGDRVSQFVLFRQASDLAAQAGDLSTAFGAIDAIERVFAVDALALKVATLSKSPTATTHELSTPAVEACFKVAEFAVRRNHYDLAALVLRKADAISRSPANVTLQAKLQARLKEMAEVQLAREKLTLAEKTLADKPHDDEANLQVGKFLCFLKGDWELGLPMLRIGSDGELRKIAETETALPTNGELRVDLADAWYKLAEREGSVVAKANLKEHSRYWYQQALPGLSGFSKTRVQKLLEDLSEEEKARWSVNLLKLIDLKKDSVAGEWKIEADALLTPATSFVRLQIPYIPPAEYELKVVAARKGGDSALIVGLIGEGRPFFAAMDGWDKTCTGLQEIDGKGVSGNETTLKRKVFTDDRPRTIICTVRKDRTKLIVDGETLIDWKADYKRVSQTREWAVKDKRVLYVASHDTVFRITEIWLTPISGQGQKLR